MDGYVFIALLALTEITLAVVLIQVTFELLETKKRRLQERLASDAGERGEFESAYKPIVIQRSADLPKVLARFAAMRALAHKLERACPTIALPRFLFLVTGTAILAGVALYLLTDSVFVSVLAGVVAAMIPFFVVNSRCQRRQRAIDDQLPEALEFLARILRAGHSLSTGLQMGADELPEPLAGEFRRCYDQHSLGQPLDVVMKEMAVRIGTSDFAFFVTAVLIQRQTGGDLAEVLGNISGMIRQRIRLQQHVKAITAEGRLVGYILLALPIVFFFILYFLNRDYVSILITTPEGGWLLFGAFMMQIFGLLTIRKIVSIKL
jgi:tight adherence protein B